MMVTRLFGEVNWVWNMCAIHFDYPTEQNKSTTNLIESTVEQASVEIWKLKEKSDMLMEV